MLTQKELQVIELFRNNLLASYTIREIMKKLNTKSYDWTYNAVKKLEKENILILEQKGHSSLCNINLEEQKTIAYLSLLEELNALDRKIPNLNKIMLLMPLDFHILIIAGSYADNTYTKKSDIDVVVIIDKKEERKWLLNRLTNEGDLLIPKLHPYIFSKDEFLEMLINKETNYGKEIAKKHIIISGAEFYFKILGEVIKRGYRN